MTPKDCTVILGMIVLISCNNSRTQPPATDTTDTSIVLTDSSKKKLVNALDEILKANSSPDDVTISAKFVKQGNYDNGYAYITVKSKDSTITLINPTPLKEDDIVKLKKDGDNVTLTYSSTNKTVKLLIANYEPEK